MPKFTIADDATTEVLGDATVLTQGFRWNFIFEIQHTAYRD